MSPELSIKPFVKKNAGTAALPGSKSITNRALIFAALCAGTVRLTGALFSRDTRIMIAALRELGFRVEADESAKTITVEGLGGKIPNASAKIFVGNAGTAARFLTALLALHPDGEYALDGDPAMRARPMSGLLRALVAQGATAAGADGKPTESFPFTLRTAGLRGGEIAVDASASSQLLSALLMVAPFAQTPATVRLAGKTVSEPFVAMTLRMCENFGCGATTPTAGVHVFENRGAYACPTAGVYAIEPDATAASYFLALPIAAPATISVENLSAGGLQGDVAFVEVLKKIGLPVRETFSGYEVSSPATPLAGGDFDFNAISDTFLTLAALAPLLTSPVTIRGIAHARKQETDRVLAMATELEKLGQRVEPPAAELRTHPEIGYITIYPNREKMRALTAGAPAKIHTYEDHRMAMSFGVLGSHDLHGDGRAWIAIEDPACCGKTFPEFFDVLENMRTNTFITVAVDGGAASGKSSTSRGVAARFNFMHVDTGAHYRTAALALTGAGVTPEDAGDVIEKQLQKISLGTVIAGNAARLAISGVVPEDAALRTPEINAVVSRFAALPPVRQFLFDYQRAQVAFARENGFAGLVMEGRDIGSVILPDADLRLFLEADPVARAARRAAEGGADSIAQRDRLDSSRATAPLACPAGATRIDSTHLTLEQVIDKVCGFIAELLPK